MKHAPASRLRISFLAAVLCAAALAKEPGAVDVTAASGVNIHFTDPQPGELEMMQEAGFRWARMDFHWQGTETAAGIYDFAAYDRLVTALEQHGIRAYFILDYSNRLYEPVGSVRSEAGRAAYATWAAAAVKHFQGRGICWEIWNEPNGAGFWPPAPDVREYIAMALAASKAIREECPDEMLVGPATSTIDMPFLEACIKGGLLEYWDGVSVHPYRQGGPESVEEDYRALRKIIAASAPGGKPRSVLSGEWGYSSAWSGFDAEMQGKMLPRQWLVNAANGVPVSVWYDWRDDGPDPKEPEHHFGTVLATYHAGRNPVFDPKPAWLAAKTFNQMLSGCRLVRRVALGSAESQGMLFEGTDGRLVLAAWTTGREEQTARVPGDMDSHITSHTGGDLGRALVKDGVMSFGISDAPRYLVFAKGNRALAAAPEALPVRMLMLPPAGGEVVVQLENLSGRSFRGKMMLEGLEGAAVAGQEVECGDGAAPERVVFRVPDAVAKPFRAGARLEAGGGVMARLDQRTFIAPDRAVMEGAKAVGEGSPEAGGTFAVSRVDLPEGELPGQPAALRLDYEFPDGWKFASVHPGAAQAVAIEEKVRPAAFGMWIEGDESHMAPRLRVVEAGGRVWQPAFPEIGWKGWKYVEARIDSDTAHWGGADPEVRRGPELPLKWEAVFLLDNPRRVAAKGTVRFTAPGVIGS